MVLISSVNNIMLMVYPQVLQPPPPFPHPPLLPPPRPVIPTGRTTIGTTAILYPEQSVPLLSAVMMGFSSTLCFGWIDYVII